MKIGGVYSTREALIVFLHNVVTEGRSGSVTHLGFSEEELRERLSHASPFMKRLSECALEKLGSLNNRRSRLERNRSEYIKKFEAIFVLRYYESMCPEECSKAYMKLTKELHQKSAALRSYTMAENALQQVTENSNFVQTLKNHVSLARRRYEREVANLKFLHDRLLMLLQYI